MDNYRRVKRTDTNPPLSNLPPSSPPSPLPISARPPRLTGHTMSARRPSESRYQPLTRIEPLPTLESILPHRYESPAFSDDAVCGYQNFRDIAAILVDVRRERDEYQKYWDSAAIVDDVRGEPEEFRNRKRLSNDIEERSFSDRPLESIEVEEALMMGSKSDWESALSSAKRQRTSSFRPSPANEDIYDLPSTTTQKGTFSQHETSNLFSPKNAEPSPLKGRTTANNPNEISLLKGPALRDHLARWTWPEKTPPHSSWASFDEAIAQRSRPLSGCLMNSPFDPDEDGGYGSSCTLRHETPSPRSQLQSPYNGDELKRSIESPIPGFKFESQGNVEDVEQRIESHLRAVNNVGLERWVPSPGMQRRMDQRLGIYSAFPKFWSSAEQSSSRISSSPISNSWVEVPGTPTSLQKIQSSQQQSAAALSDVRFQAAFNAAFENWMAQHGKVMVEAAVKEAVKEMMEKDEGKKEVKDDAKRELRFEDVAVVEDSQGYEGYTDDDEL